MTIRELTVTALIKNGQGVYRARAIYEITPKGGDKFQLVATDFEVLGEKDQKKEDLETLAKGMALVINPEPRPNGHHLELDVIVWNTKNIEDTSNISLTPEGAARIKEYIMQQSQPAYTSKPIYKFSPN